MSLAKQLVRSSLWIAASDLIGGLLSFLLVILIARSLGDVALGIYSYTFAFVSTVFFICDFGFLYYITQEMARHPKKIHLYNDYLLSLRFISCFIAVLIILGTNFLIIKDSNVRWTVLLAAVAMFFNYFAWAFRPLFQVCGKLKFEAISRIAERIVAFVLGAYFLIVLKQGIVYLMVAFVVSYFLFYVLRVYFGKQLIRIRFCPNLKIFLEVFKPKIFKKIFWHSLPFLSIILFIKLYLSINVLMISWLTGDYAVTGWYTAAASLLEGLNFIPAMVVLVLFPVMSVLFVKSKSSLQNLFNVFFRYYLTFAFPTALGIFFLADKIIFRVYPNGFSQSVLVLKLLVWAIMLGFFTQYFGVFLQSINQQKIYAVLLFILVLLNVVLNLVLIPRYSYLGAAISLIITEIFSFILLYCCILKSGFRLHLLKSAYPSILAGVLMGIFLYSFRSSNLFFLVLIGTFIFLAAFVLIGGFKREDIIFLKEVIS